MSNGNGILLNEPSLLKKSNPTRKDLTDFLPMSLYHPTSVVVVDDSESFLTELTLSLNSKLSYIAFSEPSEALDFIERSYSHEQLEKTFSENFDADNYGLNTTEHQMKIDFSNLYKKIYNPKRFMETTALVVDYSMPAMTGDEFCKRLYETSIKKIMLTSEAVDKLVINLFNEGALNKFISKSAPKCKRIVNNLIAELQKSYFIEKSKTIYEVLKRNSGFHLADPCVRQLFNDICSKYNIVEYYMIDAKGNYLLISYKGKPYYLIVSDEKELKEYKEIAQDQKASPFIIKLLDEGKKIPYFANNSELMNASGSAWEAYLQPAQKIEGHKNYYYSLVTDNLLGLQTEKILSYDDYLMNVWPPA